MMHGIEQLHDRYYEIFYINQYYYFQCLDKYCKFSIFPTRILLLQLMKKSMILSKDHQILIYLYNTRYLYILYFFKAASKFSLPKENDVKAKICPCCGYAVITEEMNLCCSRYDLNFNGAGYPLYFEFLVFAVCFTTMLGYNVSLTDFRLISGVYTTIQNSMGNRCEVVHSE